MRYLTTIAGIFLLVVILWDGFETIILPRRVTRRIRFARLFFRYTWLSVRAVAGRIRPGKRREAILSVYGPLSLLLLFVFWAAGLILGFGLLHWAAGSAEVSFREPTTFWTDLYMSGTTFFTLGLGDITPHTRAARLITVLESGTGFGFLAIVISYLPVLYGAFSRREATISLLDARAGSPPTAAELLRRHVKGQNLDSLGRFLRDWEVWSAELMESHLSFPVLCYFRSQHDNQSWLAALSAILDTCALLISCSESALQWQAQLTFAISRHALVDLAQVMNIPPTQPVSERVSENDLEQLRQLLVSAHTPVCGSAAAQQKLRDLRRMYEPYIAGFSRRLLMPYAAGKASVGPGRQLEDERMGKNLFTVRPTPRHIDRRGTSLRSYVNPASCPPWRGHHAVPAIKTPTLGLRVLYWLVRASVQEHSGWIAA